MGEEKSLLGRIVTWTVIGIVGIVALKIVVRVLGFLMGLLGMAFGIAAFLLFTVGPVLLLGWLLVKAWKAFTRDPALD